MPSMVRAPALESKDIFEDRISLTAWKRGKILAFRSNPSLPPFQFECVYLLNKLRFHIPVQPSALMFLEFLCRSAQVPHLPEEDDEKPLSAYLNLGTDIRSRATFQTGSHRRRDHGYMHKKVISFADETTRNTGAKAPRCEWCANYESKEHMSDKHTLVNG